MVRLGAAFYVPMVELVQFLEANDFTVYIVTATERNLVRALVKDTLGIPPAHVIGTISMRDDFVTIYGEGVKKDASASGN